MGTRLAAALAAAALTAGFAAPAAAITATYNLSGTCVASCAAGGLTDGQTIGGQLLVDVDAFAPNASFGASAVQSFRVEFGATAVTSGDFNSVSGRWGTGPALLAFLDLRAGTAGPNGSGPLVGLLLESSAVSLDGSCEDAPGCSQNFFNDRATIGPLRVSGTVGASPLAPVPLPPALALSLAGMAALFVAGRRRRGAAAKGVSGA
jgi:hypothetical protein